VKDYEGEEEDKELLHLADYLMEFIDVADVREKIVKDFNISRFL